jgi:hypothetical protein
MKRLEADTLTEGDDVVLLLENRMSRQGGRPKRGEERSTALVRAYADLAEMVKWVCLVQGTASAKLLDPIIRPEIVSLFTRHYETILTLARSRGEADGLPTVLGVNAPLNERDDTDYTFPSAGPKAEKAEPTPDPKAKAKPKKPKP